MKEVSSKKIEAVEEAKQPEFTKVTYEIEDINQLMKYLGGQPFEQVTGIIDMLKNKAELS